MVCVYNQEDGVDWSSYIVSQLDSITDLPLVICKELDQHALIEDIDTDTLTHIQDARVLIILMTPNLEEHLKNNPNVDLKKFLPKANAKFTVLLFCGIEESDLGPMKNRFAFYDNWHKDVITNDTDKTAELVKQLSTGVADWLATQSPEDATIDTQNTEQCRGGDTVPASSNSSKIKDIFFVYPRKCRCDVSIDLDCSLSIEVM